MFVKCSNLKLLTHSLSVHPHWVLGCSRSQHLFFLFSLVLGLNTLPGVLAFCMAYAWLGELTRHTFLSHSLGLMSFFFFCDHCFLPHPRWTSSLCPCVCIVCICLMCVCVDLSSCVSVVYCVFTCSGTPKPLTLPSPPSPSCPFVLPPLIKMF